jgi:hypothetical protein
LLGLVAAATVFKTRTGEIETPHTAGVAAISKRTCGADPVIHNTTDGNVVIFFGDKLVLKFFRRVEAGINPELEVGRFLTEKNFRTARRYWARWNIAAAKFADDAGRRQGIRSARQNGWEFTLDAIGSYYERVVATSRRDMRPLRHPLKCGLRRDLS